MQLIVGVDGSDYGLRALGESIERAQQLGGDVTVALYSDGQTALDEIESLVSEELSAYDIDVDVIWLEEEPGSQLIELAEREGYDQIVLPGGQRSPLGKINLSNTIEFVLLNAQTTVTLVR